MPGIVRQTVLHKTLAESTVNTLKTELVEIPNTTGAQAVKLDRVLLQVDAPENVSATLTEMAAAVGVTNCKAALDSAAEIDCSVAGVVAVIESRRYTTTLYGNTYVEIFPNRQIGKDSDGKFYVVVACKGANNTAVKNASFSMEFTVL